LIGKVLAHYEITDQIGSGGMGEVYRARDTKLGRDVALKILPDDMAQDENRRKRFEREARAIAQLKHPNIVTIFSVEEAGGVHFMTMELIEGRTLADVIPKGGLPLVKFFELAIPMADAVASAHNNGITHRDLKPNNIMISDEGHLQVLDFGLAKFIAPSMDEARTLGADSDTAEGVVMGTVSYMSPEQAEGKEIDHRSDIFSLGIIFYEMVTGEKPFKGDSNISILSSILKEEPTSVSDVKSILPLQLGRIIHHCLAKEPERRFQSALDVSNQLQALRAEVSSQTITGQHPVLTKAAMPVKRIGIMAAIGLVVVVAAVFGLRSLTGGGPAGVSEANAMAVFSFDYLKDPDDPERLGQIIQELLIADLSSVQPLKVYSSQRLSDIQRQLEKGRDDSGGNRLTSDVARRAGAETMLTGTVTQLGGRWVITCQLANVSDGTVVQSQRADGSDVYALVEQLGRQLQIDLNLVEPVEVAQKLTIQQKTTGSLDAYRHYLNGVDLINQMQFHKAADELRKSIEIDPDFGQAYYKLAIATYFPGDSPRAARAPINELLTRKLYRSDLERLMAEGLLHLINNQFTEGLPKFQELVEKFPEEKEAWYQLGEALYHFPDGANKAEAVVAFERVVELDPDFLLAYDHIFDEMWDDDRYNEAIARADQLIARDPDNVMWYRLKALTGVQTAPQSEVGSILEAALPHMKSADDRRELYYRAAQKAGNRGLGIEQEAFLLKALAEDPDQKDPRVARALMGLLRPQARWDEYEQWTRQALEEDPDNPALLENLFRVYEETRRYADAVIEARRLADKYPDDPRWTRFWLENAIRRGEPQGIREAFAAAEAAAKTKDDRRYLNNRAAWAYVEEGETNLSYEYHRKALAEEPDKPLPYILNNMGWRDMNRGRYEAAARLFQRSLDVNPKDQFALWSFFMLSCRKHDVGAMQEYQRRLEEAAPTNPYVEAIPIAVAIASGRMEDARVRAAAFLGKPATEWDRFDRLQGVSEALLNYAYPSEAIPYLEEAVTLPTSGRDPRANTLLGE
jgi:tetratricopeptide (TPR) repeat protein